jgi:hypothetical protein
VDYPKAGEAQIAETTTLEGERLIVRRVRTLGVQAQLFETWRHFAALPNRTEPLALVEAEHRDHATVELDIRDLLDQALAHAPSGQFARERRLDSDRRDRAQPAPRERTDRPARQNDPPPRAHQPPPTARDARPPHLPQPTLDAAPPRPLALTTDWQAALTRIRALPVLS